MFHEKNHEMNPKVQVGELWQFNGTRTIAIVTDITAGPTIHYRRLCVTFSYGPNDTDLEQIMGYHGFVHCAIKVSGLNNV